MRMNKNPGGRDLKVIFLSREEGNHVDETAP